MGAEGERGKRAGNYVRGLMDDVERERAERDLEFDPAFRDAVMRIADEMHLFDRAEVPGNGGERWKLVARRIADLPQMRPAGMEAGPATRPVIDPLGRRPIGMGLHDLPNRRALLIVIGLIAAFVMGYLAGKL